MPTTRLKSSVIAKALKTPTPRILWDASLAGFGFRIRPGVEGIRAGWIFKYRLKGERAARWLSLKYPANTADEARTWARRKQRILDAGSDPGAAIEPVSDPDASIPTLAAYAKRYVERKGSGESHKSGRRAKASTLRTDEGNLARICRDFPKVASSPLHQITESDVLKIVRDRERPVAGNRYLALIRHLLNVAAEDPNFSLRSATTPGGERWRNPCAGIGATKERARQPRPGPDVWPRLFALLDRYSAWPTPEALKAKRRNAQLETPKGEAGDVSEMNPVIAAVIKLQALTGARGSEIRKARRSLITFHETPGDGPDSKPIRTGTLKVIDPKEGGEKEIPLSPEAVAVVESIPAVKGCDFVFPGRSLKAPIEITTVLHWWSRHRGEAGLDGFRLHDLRHFVAGELVAAGASLTQIGELFGHKSPATTARYAYLDDSKKQALASLVAGRITALAGGGSNGKA